MHFFFLNKSDPLIALFRPNFKWCVIIQIKYSINYSCDVVICVACISILYFLFPRLSASSRIAHLLPEEQVYLNQQSGTIRLDCFTHCLIVKCAPDITVSAVSLPFPVHTV